MFANTITITIAPSTDRILNRINQDAYGSEYAYSDVNEVISMKIRHSTDSVDADGVKMRRHNVFFERVVYATPTVAIKKYTSTCTLRESIGSDPAASALQTKGVNAWIASGTIAADLAVGVN